MLVGKDTGTGTSEWAMVDNIGGTKVKKMAVQEAGRYA